MCVISPAVAVFFLLTGEALLEEAAMRSKPLDIYELCNALWSTCMKTFIQLAHNGLRASAQKLDMHACASRMSMDQHAQVCCMKNFLQNQTTHVAKSNQSCCDLFSENTIFHAKKPFKTHLSDVATKTTTLRKIRGISLNKKNYLLIKQKPPLNKECCEKKTFLMHVLSLAGMGVH